MAIEKSVVVVLIVLVVVAAIFAAPTLVEAWNGFPQAFRVVAGIVAVLALGAVAFCCYTVLTMPLQGG